MFWHFFKFTASALHLFYPILILCDSTVLVMQRFWKDGSTIGPWTSLQALTLPWKFWWWCSLCPSRRCHWQVFRQQTRSLTLTCFSGSLTALLRGRSCQSCHWDEQAMMTMSGPPQASSDCTILSWQNTLSFQRCWAMKRKCNLESTKKHYLTQQELWRRDSSRAD